MAVGPIQVIVFGFESTDKFQGEVLEELATLRGRGLIRLVDLMVVVKDAAGLISQVELPGLSEEEAKEFGGVLGKLLRVEGVEVRDVAAAAIDRTLVAASASLGFDKGSVHEALENLDPGKAYGVLMFEHTWAIPLGAAIRRAGGVPLAQGFVTPEALVMVGQELEAMAEAARAIEVSEIVRSVAILDTLATMQQAEAIKTAIAADVVRTLAIAELIEEAAVAEAIETLAAAGAIEQRYLEEAAQAEAQQAAEMQKVFAEAGA